MREVKGERRTKTILETQNKVRDLPGIKVYYSISSNCGIVVRRGKWVMELNREFQDGAKHLE